MRTIWFGLFVGLIATTGCGDAGPSVVPVSGKVTLDGKALSGATITFAPADEANAGLGGMATSDADGGYKLSSTKGGNGVPPGVYRVTVSKAELKNPALAETGGISESDLKQLVPLNYTKSDETPLKLTVEAGDKPLDIAIVSKK